MYMRWKVILLIIETEKLIGKRKDKKGLKKDQAELQRIGNQPNNC